MIFCIDIIGFLFDCNSLLLYFNQNCKISVGVFNAILQTCLWMIKVSNNILLWNIRDCFPLHNYHYLKDIDSIDCQIKIQFNCKSTHNKTRNKTLPGERHSQLLCIFKFLKSLFSGDFKFFPFRNHLRFGVLASCKNI